jgi:hypothetical protein
LHATGVPGGVRFIPYGRVEHGNRFCQVKIVAAERLFFVDFWRDGVCLAKATSPDWIELVSVINKWVANECSLEDLEAYPFVSLKEGAKSYNERREVEERLASIQDGAHDVRFGTGNDLPQVSNITGVQIVLKVEERNVLFILLDDKCSINRMGDGSPTSTDQDFFIGLTPEPLLPELLKHLTDDMLCHLGGYDVPKKVGETCELTIRFRFADGNVNGFQFRYGLESQGPPREIFVFVIRAIALTDPWYKKFKSQKATAGNKETTTKKPWWRIW